MWGGEHVRWKQELTGLTGGASGFPGKNCVLLPSSSSSNDNALLAEASRRACEKYAKSRRKQEQTRADQLPTDVPP
eukprot:gene19429-biopygen14564